MTPSRLLPAWVSSALVLASLSACAGTPGPGSVGTDSATPSGTSATSGCHLNASTGLFDCPSGAPEASVSASVPVSPASLALAHYQDTFTSSDGYKVNISVAVSPVMLGTDTSALASAWSAVGGSGDVPCTSGTPDNENPNFTIQPGTTGYAFGTVQLTNGSPGFTPQNQTYLLHGLSGAGAAGFGFSDGSQCKSLYEGFNFTPTWTGDSWGPVPIVIAVYNYRSPAHPDGDPSKLEEGMDFGVNDFKVPLTSAT